MRKRAIDPNVRAAKKKLRFVMKYRADAYDGTWNDVVQFNAVLRGSGKLREINSMVEKALKAHGERPLAGVEI